MLKFDHTPKKNRKAKALTLTLTLFVTCVYSIYGPAKLLGYGWARLRLTVRVRVRILVGNVCDRPKLVYLLVYCSVNIVSKS